MALGQDGAHGMILCVDQFATKFVQLDAQTDEFELIARKTLLLSDACYLFKQTRLAVYLRVPMTLRQVLKLGKRLGERNPNLMLLGINVVLAVHLLPVPAPGSSAYVGRLHKFGDALERRPLGQKSGGCCFNS